MRTTRAAGLVMALGVSFGVAGDAQPRPMIPEIACIRVSVVAVPVAGSRSVGLRIVNSDPSSFRARIHAEIAVEREVSGHWQHVTDIFARSSCRGPSPTGCVEIEPRSTLEVAPWAGMVGDAQCACERCVRAPAGRYRFVVTTCDNCFNPEPAYSQPFALP